ncbi:hypothetical protein PNP85_12580 [Halobacterium salinarum]|uniref:hypothetical protein n=1 Tax=Halobacterium salinarum TaxID=2242 RepID=UPI0025548EB9|nr:hypothetical protein [Halobacterium salinarum]MDL0140339.1 hypothetical protein [Halobacterium salinarum]
MPEIHTERFQPESGMVVELPEKIGRKDIGRYGGGVGGDGTLEIAVVGRGELADYVILEAHEGKATIPDGAEILGVDHASGTVYVAIPRDSYRGGSQ